MLRKWSLVFAALTFSASASTILSSGLQSATACTEVLLNKSKGVLVSGRTLDYDCEMGSKICFKAKGSKVSDPGLKFTKLASEPLTWTAKYSAVVVDAFDEPAYVDGMNTEGLAVGTLWDADTQPARQVASGTQGLSNVALVEYILESAKSIDEAKKLISDLSLVISIYKGQPMALHWIVTERSGKSVVMELRNGRPTFYDQSTDIGVMANAPSYEKQMANLKECQTKLSTDQNYILPGDYQSTSRFVRSAFLVSHLPELKTADDAVSAATSILHNVESPKGAQGPKGSYTQWIAVRDQLNLRYVLMGVKHPAPKIIDLNACDFEQLAGRRIAVDSSSSGDIAQFAELKSAQSPSSGANQ